MKLKPWQDHRWKAIPSSATERYDALNIICNKRLTCHVTQKKYFDIDTGKFDFDKMETIESISIGELYSDSPATYYYQPIKERRVVSHNDKAWFKPKDNDFDEECRRDEELRQNKERIKVEATEKIRSQQRDYAVEMAEQKELEKKNRINFIMDINNKISTIYRCSTTTDYEKLKEIIKLVEEVPTHMKDEYSQYKQGLYQTLYQFHVAQRKEAQNVDKKINEINNNANLSYQDKIKKKIVLISNINPDLREIYRPLKEFLFEELINHNLKNKENEVFNRPAM